MLLLDEKVFEEVSLYRSRGDDDKVKSLFSKYDCSESFSSIDCSSLGLHESQTISQINVFGFLSNSSEDGTSYLDLIQDIKSANADDSVKTIQLNVNSPGGNAEGIMPAMLAISESKKPIISVVGEMAASGAYMLASQSNFIFALHELSSFGSVGVVAEWLDFSKAFKDMGIESKVFTNTDSPLKRLDLETEEGKKEFVKELDSFYSVIESHISKGRGVSKDFIKANFGRGGMLIAEDAIKNKMADGVVMSQSSIDASSPFGIWDCDDSGSVFISSGSLSIEGNLEDFSMREEKEMVSKEEILLAEKLRVSEWLMFVDVDHKSVKEGIESGKALDSGSAAILAAKKTSVNSLVLETENPEDLVVSEEISKLTESEGDKFQRELIAKTLKLGVK